MAVIKCHECGAEVSTEATGCMKCGAPPRRPVAGSGRAILIAGCFGLLLFGPFFFALKGCISRYAPAPKTPQQTAAEAQSDANMSRARTHILMLRQSMKDPKSFDLEYARVGQDGSACIEYRATNSFGASLRGRAVLTLEGSLLVQERDKNKFVKAWNSLCTQGGGIDLAPLLRQRGEV